MFTSSDVVSFSLDENESRLDKIPLDILEYTTMWYLCQGRFFGARLFLLDFLYHKVVFSLFVGGLLNQALKGSERLTDASLDIGKGVITLSLPY